MSVDEFIFDLGEFEEEVVEEHATQERVRKSGWRKEKGRYLCLVPNCRERKLDFVRKFALVRHWEEVHVSTIELSKSTVQSSCQSLKRAYDLERHYRRKHELNHLQAKPLSQGEKLKRKVVENRNYVAPGTLVGPKDKLGTGLGKPFTETRPGPNEMEVTLAVVRVEIDNVLDEEVDMILQSVPEPEIKKVIGINLSHKEQERKNKLIKDIWTARVLIREWTRREKEAKDELKRLEVKEQRLREKVLQEQLRGERSERRKMEVEMRQLKGQMDRRKSVFDYIDVLKYEVSMCVYVYFILIWHLIYEMVSIFIFIEFHSTLTFIISYYILVVICASYLLGSKVKSAMMFNCILHMSFIVL